MTSSISRLVIDQTPGEVRAAAVDERGRAWHVFLSRFGGAGDPPRLSECHEGLVREIAETQGGAFVELRSGAMGLLRLRRDKSFHLGERVNVSVVAEARGDKLARLELTNEVPRTGPPLDMWRQQIGAADEIEFETDGDAVDLAFDEATDWSPGLSGGGRLHIEPTRALVSVDVDSAGRVGKGSAGARALSLSREAVQESARHILLKSLGGLVVIDCPGPFNRNARDKVKMAFQSTLSAATDRSVKVFGPSELGLLQASVAWQGTPIHERLNGAEGLETPETRLLQSLRDTTRAVQAETGRFFALALGPIEMEAYLAQRASLEADLQTFCFGRIEIKPSESGQTELRRL